MAKVDYPIYKIRRDPHSKKVQSLAVGDVVRRSYYDAPRQVYSLMVVLDTGTETIGNAEVPYFTGALIEGDEPRGEELLDFVRITNLSIRSAAELSTSRHRTAMLLTWM